MLSATYLADAADVLSRGFGRQKAKAISLTLVEFKNSETARQVSPWGSWTRAVPIQEKKTEIEEVGRSHNGTGAFARIMRILPAKTMHQGQK